MSQMDKYTFISLYKLQIFPTRQILCLNKYFLIWGNKCSIKNLLRFLNCDFVLFFSHLLSNLSLACRRTEQEVRSVFLLTFGSKTIQEIRML